MDSYDNFTKCEKIERELILIQAHHKGHVEHKGKKWELGTGSYPCNTHLMQVERVKVPGKSQF